MVVGRKIKYISFILYDKENEIWRTILIFHLYKTLKYISFNDWIQKVYRGSYQNRIQKEA